MEIFISILKGVIITAIAYLVVPVLFCTSEKKRTEKQIKKIVTINGICVWLIFMIINISLDIKGASGALFLWSGVAYCLMKKFCLDVPNTEEHSFDDEQKIYTSSQDAQSYTEVSLSLESEQPTSSNGFYGKDMLLEKNTENLNNDYSLSKQDKNIEYNKSLQSMRCNSTEDIAPVKKSEISSKLSYREEKIAIHKDYKEKKKEFKSQRHPTSIKTFKTAIIALSLVLAIVCVVSGIVIASYSKQLKTIEQKLTTAEAQLKVSRSLEESCNKKWLEEKEKAENLAKYKSFMNKYIALIDSEENYHYHTFNCPDFKNAESFYLYDIESAKSKGYIECEKCHGLYSFLYE